MKQVKLILSLVLAFTLAAFSLPEKLEKKVDKELASYFEEENYQKTAVDISAEAKQKLNKNFDPTLLFKITHNEKLLGYAYVGSAPSKTAVFDYMVIFNEDLIVAKSKVLIYREEYGGEIGSKRWLKQFNGAQKTDELKFTQDIIGISGATISATSMTNAVNNVLKGVNTLYDNNMF